MADVEAVAIDGEGCFKYILIEAGVGEAARVLVRGTSSAEYHIQVLEGARKQHPGVPMRCLGGGRIEHEPAAKRILVYGYSVQFGRANHELAVELLKAAFPAYQVSFSNEGY